MNRPALLKCRTERAMQPVFKVELATPGNHVGEQVAVERGIFVQQGVQFKGSFGGDQLIQPDLLRRNRRPVPMGIAMIGVWPSVADSFEDHPTILSAHRSHLVAC